MTTTTSVRFQWRGFYWTFLTGAILAFNLLVNWGTINEANPGKLFGTLLIACSVGMAVMVPFVQRR